MSLLLHIRGVTLLSLLYLIERLMMESDLFYLFYRTLLIERKMEKRFLGKHSEHISSLFESSWSKHLFS